MIMNAFDIHKMHVIFRSRVRKLTGKPAFLTIADCESEARRIHLIYYEIRVSFRAMDSKV